MALDVLLVSTYELGRQPFGLASPAAWLLGRGHRVRCLDLAVEDFDEGAVRGADLVGFFLPMHTATRIAAGAIEKTRALNPRAHLCAYGLYAPPNAQYLAGVGVGSVLGGEFEKDLADLADAIAAGRVSARSRGEGPRVSMERLAFQRPRREGLPPLARYAHLTMPDGTRRIVGNTLASRGCKHRCRHCPVVPVYNGRFRIVAPDVVLADIGQQVAAGAQHVSFGDPDFFNSARHAMDIAGALHRKWPALSYDVTIKVEHLLRHRERLAELRRTGCAFVTTAAESVDDAVLGLLDKGHTAADFERVVALCREAGLPLAPTFIAFTPWTTLEGYARLLETLCELGLVESVAPVQLTLRLLVPAGSYLLGAPETQRWLGPFDPAVLSYRWENPDPRVEALWRRVAALAEGGGGAPAPRQRAFENIWRATQRALGRKGAAVAASSAAGPLPPVPVMSEPWYCCAEPTEGQLARV